MSSKYELDSMVQNSSAAHGNGNGNGNGNGHKPATLDSASMQEIYAELLKRIGEDPTRDGLLSTPKRMEKSMAFLTQGYLQSAEDVLHDALFDVDYDEMVMVKDIEFYSMSFTITISS